MAGPKVLSTSQTTYCILKLHDSRCLDHCIPFPKGITFLKVMTILASVYFISKRHFPPEGAGKCSQPLLGFWISRLYSKGITFLKLQENIINHFCCLGDRPRPHTLYILKLPGPIEKAYFISKGHHPTEGAGRCYQPLFCSEDRPHIYSTSQ